MLGFLHKNMYKMFHKPSITLMVLTNLLTTTIFAQDLSTHNQEAKPNITQKEYNPKEFIGKLNKRINETSGLIFLNGNFYTHNDSGGEPEIYAIDTADGSIKQTIRINHAVNVDWEDITYDNNNLYIGDFGNNYGTRRDLCVYKVPLKEIHKNEDCVANAEKIGFSYEDQTLFEAKNRNNNYDCEALIAWGDQIILFTKNWGDHKTRLYSLNKEPGQQQAHLLSSFDTKGLITGADVKPGKQEVVLSGYLSYEPFIWVIKQFTPTSIVEWETLRVDFPNRAGSQTEGICFAKDNNLYISSEETKIYSAKIYKVDYQKITDKFPEPGEQVFKFDYTILDQTIRLRSQCEACKKYSITLLNRKGEALFHTKIKGVKTEITTLIPFPADERGLVLKLASGSKTASARIN